MGLLRSPGRFYARLVEQEKDRKNTPTDVYIWMLGVDFICFIIIMFGYWAFGKHSENNSGDITVEIKENVVPTSFLYLLFTHFFLILVGMRSIIIWILRVGSSAQKILNFFGTIMFFRNSRP